MIKPFAVFTLSAFALACTSALAATGTYQGKALGHNAEVEVAVTLDNDKITNVQILKNFETPAVSELPKKVIPQMIVDNQSLKVDRISGATFSSMAILNAVKDALKKAGVDPQKYMQGSRIAYKVSVPTKTDSDVVVVGGGGAGLSAAVAAARKGAKVVLIEKMSFLGGNTVLAGGALNASDPALEAKQKMSAGQRKMVEDLLKEEPKNEQQAKLLASLKKQWDEAIKKDPDILFDCPELHALQTYKAGDYVADLALIDKLSKLAPATVERLDKMGLKWNDFSSQYVGAIWPRCHDAANYTSGQGYIDTFRHTIEKEKLPVTILLQTKADELIKKDGRVVGVKATGPNGEKVTLNAKKGVIMTSGGFGANVEMRQKFDKLWGGKLGKNIGTTNSRAITGEGILMAEKAGAGLVDMGYIQLLPVTDPENGTVSGICQGTAIYVNTEGKRFVNEMGRRDELSKAALAQPGGVFYRMCTVKNARINKDGLTTLGIPVETFLKSGKVIRGENVEDLASKIKVDPKVLKATFDKFNDFCRSQGEDKEFGRPSCAPNIPMYEGPYYAELRTPSVHHTMGGVRINTNAQVLDTAGKPIPGLFAAGEVTGGIHGTNRVGGNAIADALTYGNVAGESAVK
ncbi:flavocytochrome c [Turicimonas muris]|uniref:flavocytochrome c n=3 Tax=Turicimonas muris TaxID=1796652 RepID=UPI0025A532D1|nr:flavocytochrome c [Turicimonas muris]